MTTLTPQGHRYMGSKNPTNVLRTPQRPWLFLTHDQLVQRTTALTTAANKAPVLFEPGSQAGFQNDIANGRLFFPTPPEGSCLFSCFGTGAENKEGRLAVWGWQPSENTHRYSNSGYDIGWWEPTLLLITHPVLGARTGIAQASGGTRPPVNDTEYYADQFVTTTDYTLSPGFRQIGSGADSIAHAIFDYVGFPLLEFELTCRDSSDGTTNNCTGLAIRVRTL